MHPRQPILLIEDDMVDVMSVEKALVKLKLNHPLQVAGNGEEALELLRNGNADVPSLILLDLNMPRMNGLEFLKTVKADRKLRRIPVVVLTTSGEEDGLRDCFELGVAGYMKKPVGFDRFVEIIRTIVLYWTTSESPD